MFTEMQQMRGVSGKFGEKMSLNSDPRLAMAQYIQKQRKQMLSPYVAQPHTLPNRKELAL